MRTILRSALLFAALVGAIAACDDDDPVNPDSGPFTLTFEGNATFHGAHGGQQISVALVRDSDGNVVGTEQGALSAVAVPAFSFTFANLLEADESYSVHYWIDSNFGGGEAGVCDEPGTDHQWDVAIGTLDTDLTHTEDHRPGDTTDVCATFEG
jgi:hypothetical protein